MVCGGSSARIVGLLCAAFMLVNCWGQTIRLGDGNAGGDTSMGGSDVDPGGVANGGTTSPATGGALGTGGSPACEPSVLSASEVLWVGDTWVTIPGDQHSRVRDLARAQGLIGPSEEFAIAAAPFAGIDDVVKQYDDRQAGPIKVKILIGDGGTWDTIATQGSQTSVARVVSSFGEFLSKLASEGSVEHIIYYLPPELPMIPGVAALRPGLQDACRNSVVPCHFIDLQQLWVGHPEYTSDDGIQASVQGARVIADAVWQTLQTACIAR